MHREVYWQCTVHALSGCAGLHCYYRSARGSYPSSALTVHNLVLLFCTAFDSSAQRHLQAVHRLCTAWLCRFALPVHGLIFLFLHCLLTVRALLRYSITTLDRNAPRGVLEVHSKCTAWLYRFALLRSNSTASFSSFCTAF